MKQEFSSLSTSKFKTIIPIRKIQTIALLKQEQPLPFPYIEQKFKCNCVRKTIQFHRLELNLNIQQVEQTQLTKKIRQTIRSNIKKCVYQYKADEQQITQNQQTSILKITITYEGRDTIYEFNHHERNHQSIKNKSNFKSKNLLKILGVFDQNNTRPIFTFKIRSFYQMYLQNHLEWNYIHFYDNYLNSNYENSKKLIQIESSQPIYYNSLNQLFRLNEINTQFIYDQEQDQFESSFKILDCKNKQQYNKQILYNIVSKLNDQSQNQFLTKFTYDEPYFDEEQNKCASRFIRQDNFSITDQVTIAKRYYDTYNILYGDFEDVHEIENFEDNITMLEFDENIIEQNIKEQQQQIIIKPKKLNFESIMKKSNKIETLTNEISPRSDHSQISTIMRTPRENYLLPIKCENSKIKLRTSPPSYDENISLKQSTHHSKTTSQPEMISISTQRAQRKSLAANLSLRTSMTKNSLKTRTLVVEQIKRSNQSISDLIPVLIQENKQNELIELLNSNPNIRLDERLSNGNTFLMVAAQSGNSEICEFLLSKGAMVNLQNLQGDTALHKAFQYSHFSIADLLVSYGAQVLKNNKGKTPWQI